MRSHPENLKTDINDECRTVWVCCPICHAQVGYGPARDMPFDGPALLRECIRTLATMQCGEQIEQIRMPSTPGTWNAAWTEGDQQITFARATVQVNE